MEEGVEEEEVEGEVVVGEVVVGGPAHPHRTEQRIPLVIRQLIY